MICWEHLRKASYISADMFLGREPGKPTFVVRPPVLKANHIHPMTKTSHSFAFALILSSVLLLSGVANAQPVVLDSEQSAFLTLINNFRAQNGAGPLGISPKLQNSSQWMSTDMATKNYFSHTDSLGRDPFTRMAAFGYSSYTAGENIAAGNATAQNTLVQWQTACDADGAGNCTYAHRVNMLNPAFKAIGIGRAYGASSAYGWYWTTDFGGTLDTPGPTPAPAPTVSAFTANPPTVAAGQATTLFWTVSGANTITIDNGVGDVSNLSSITVRPAQFTTYKLTATNSGGSTTATATVIVNSVTDNQPPTTPTITSIFARSSSEVDLAWSPSSDNVGVTGYQLIRNGFVLNSVSGGSVSYVDSSTSPNTTYIYSLRAFDAAGNYSNVSNSAQVTTPGSPTPPPPQGPQSIVPFSGSQQIAVVNSVYSAPLQAKVLDASGNPVAGVTVTFTTPSGPSATFSGSGNVAYATTNAGGIATSPTLTANSAPGSFTVTASVPGVALASFSLTNIAAQTPPPPPTGTTTNIFTDPNPSVRYLIDGNPMELGLKFRSDAAGSITGVRFFKWSRDTGTHTGSLWMSTGQLLATGTFTNETGSGWQTLTFSSPVPITANTTYVASYHTPAAMAAISFGAFQSAGVDNAPLHALRSGVDGPNGVFAYSSGGTFPSNGSNGDNYWVDVVFSSSGGQPPPPPATPASVVAVSGSPQSANVSSAFAAPLQAKVLDAASNPLSGVTVTFAAPSSGAGAMFTSGNVAYVTTNASGVATSPALTANSIAGSYSITASVPGVTPAVFALTNKSVQPPPPPPMGTTSTIFTDPNPSVRYLIDGNPMEFGVKFRSDVAGSITGVRFFKWFRDTGSHTGSLWTSTGQLLATGTFTNETGSGWQTLLFSSPVPISANTTYVASFHTPSAMVSVNFGAFQAGSIDNPPLHALSGVFSYSSGGTFPSNGYADNYWVDVLFVH